MAILFGVTGSYIGGFIFRALGISSSGETLRSIVVATVGAVVLVLLPRMVCRL